MQSICPRPSNFDDIHISNDFISLLLKHLYLTIYFIHSINFVQCWSSYPVTICSKRIITHTHYVRQFSCQMQHMRVFGITLGVIKICALVFRELLSLGCINLQNLCGHHQEELMTIPKHPQLVKFG